jgi:FkbH-like protein
MNKNHSFNELYALSKLKNSHHKLLKIALLGNVPNAFYTSCWRGCAEADATTVEVLEADYDTAMQEASNENSTMYQSKFDAIILHFDCIKLQQQYYQTANQQGFVEQYVSFIHQLIAAIAQRCISLIIHVNYPEIDDSIYGNLANEIEDSWLATIKKINHEIDKRKKTNPQLVCYDMNKLTQYYGWHHLHNAVQYSVSKNYLNLDGSAILVQNLYELIQTRLGKAIKCVVLDLDNTLWGGVIGDDGVAGITLGGDGIGAYYVRLQAWLLQLKNRGILLAVCSKNTESVAKQGFEHPDMVLKLTDIVCFVANWDNKATNIESIKTQLNIGYSAMVFIDDNAYERELVKAALPELTVPNMPDDPADYLDYLVKCQLFEAPQITDEDKERTFLYQNELKRNEDKVQYFSEDEFLKNCKMVCEVAPVNDFNADRIAQLSQRSNQFNLRTQRYQVSDMHIKKSDTNTCVRAFTLKDNYGSHGLVAYWIVDYNQNLAHIDSWVMSCRVLKRTLEQAMLHVLVDVCKLNNIEKIIGTYIPTSEMVRDFYPQLGFVKTFENTYELDVATYSYAKTFVEIQLT